MGYPSPSDPPSSSSSDADQKPSTHARADGCSPASLSGSLSPSPALTVLAAPPTLVQWGLHGQSAHPRQMSSYCGYSLQPEEHAAIQEAWQAWQADPTGIAVCTAPLEVAHRYAIVAGACGGFTRVKFEGALVSVSAFARRFEKDTAPGMFRLDQALAPLDQTTTSPLFSTRQVDNPDLVVVLVEPVTFSFVNGASASSIRRLVANRPVLLLCWWYPANDELLKVALHDLFGRKNIFSPAPQRVPRLCDGCDVRRVDASGGAATCLQNLRAAGEILLQSVRHTVQNVSQATFDTAFTLLKNIHNAVAVQAKCQATLDAAIADGDFVVIISEYTHIHDHVVRAFKKQSRFTFAAFTKAMVFDTTKFLNDFPVAAGAPAEGQRCRLLFADGFFVERELEMCVHLVNKRFPASGADVFTWTCDAEACVSRDWSPAPSKDVVISALRCFLP
jgi:hypothetical protein